MAEAARDMACFSRCHSSRRLHDEHFRYLLQDSHCTRHGSRRASLQRPGQAPRVTRRYVLRNRTLHVCRIFFLQYLALFFSFSGNLLHWVLNGLGSYCYWETSIRVYANLLTLN